LPLTLTLTLALALALTLPLTLAFTFALTLAFTFALTLAFTLGLSVGQPRLGVAHCRLGIGAGCCVGCFPGCSFDLIGRRRHRV
jgi:hypothetical protein